MQDTRVKIQEDTVLDRRSLLKYTLGGVTSMALPMSVFGQAPAATIPINDNLTLIRAGGANQLALTTSEGVVLVDSGPATATDSLMAALDTLHDSGVHTLFNSHWHADQVGGNELFGRRGAQIIAHQKTHQRLSIAYYIPHEERYQVPYPEAAWPTTHFHDHGVMTAGDETIEYSALVQPHTDSDITVYFRDANVLAVGDALSPERDPELDWFGGGWLGGRVDSQKQLLAMTNADTVIVPAYGAVMSQADLEAELDLTQELYNRVLNLIREGCSAGCMLSEGALDGLGRTWNDPDKFLYDAYKGMWAHHYNLAPNIL